MKRFQAIVGVAVIVLAAAAATPAGAENVLRWASATEALTFDPHAANHTPTSGCEPARSMSRWSTSTPAMRSSLRSPSRGS